MAGPLLYSTNTFLKFLIHQRFRAGVHWVWCSEMFDSRKEAAYSTAWLVAPSANPADIYRELRRDVEGRDLHSGKIATQKATLRNLACQWQAQNEITAEEKHEITHMVTTAGIEYWRPLVYVIPRAALQDRLCSVPISKRAGFGSEYIIKNLKREEFDLLEL